LWTWSHWDYTDGTSTDSFTPTYQSLNGKAYEIEVNKNEILFFYGAREDKEIEVAVDPFTLKVFKIGEETNYLDLTGRINFGYIGQNGFTDLLIDEFNGLYNYHVATGEGSAYQEVNGFSYSFANLFHNLKNTENAKFHNMRNELIRLYNDLA
jgi:hypothetical protein